MHDSGAPHPKGGGNDAECVEVCRAVVVRDEGNDICLEVNCLVLGSGNDALSLSALSGYAKDARSPVRQGAAGDGFRDGGG